MAKKLQKGKPIEELVKGSLDYTMNLIKTAFMKQFPHTETGPNFWISEIFTDHVIVRTSWDSASRDLLKEDEYFMVTYTRSGEKVTFRARDQWEVVELTYQPQTVITETMKKSGSRFEERIDPSQVQLLEAKDESKKTRRIRINELVVADKKNGNKRLYPKSVIEAMVNDWRPYLRESRGQGRLMILTGEVEHPSDKGKKRPEFLETVVRWDTLDWDGNRLDIEGDLILTSKGRDVEILMEAGVNPGGSIRGIGESKIKKIDGEKVEIVEWVSLNAADLVGDPSFVNAAELQESQIILEDEMDLLEQLKKLLAEHPELFGNGMTEAKLDEMNEKALQKLEESLRAKLNVGPDADLGAALDATIKKARQFEESQHQKEIDAAIAEATKELPFGEKLNKLFVEAIKAGKFANADEVKEFAESKRKEYGQLAAAGVLKDMGFDESKQTFQVIGDVLETQTGTPEFARAAFLIHESIRNVENKAMRVLKEGVTPNDIFAVKLLERYDQLYRTQLMRESKMLAEAELTTDLDLPYSVQRAIIEEAYPDLVASGIFDVGLMNNSPEKLYFETFSGETGYTGTVTDEETVADAAGTWVDLDYKRITPGTFVLTTDPAGTTYTEGTDYVVDYANGKYQILAAGSISEDDDLLADYTYTAVRKGEMAEIERGKLTLASITIEAAADRLSDQISDEAVVFSRSQLGYDATGRTLSNLAKQLRRKIDQGMLYLALTSALKVASNSGGTWTYGTDSLDVLVKYLGIAKVLVGNRYYMPTSILASMTNAERASHWDGFTAAGARPGDERMGTGFAGRINGLPLFWSTEFSDSYFVVCNRQIVQHRVYKPMNFQGPFHSVGDNNKLVAAKQYYAEEYNATESPVAEKAAYVKVATA